MKKMYISLFLLVPCIISLVTFGLYQEAGLTTAERIQLNTAINQYPQKLANSVALIADFYPTTLVLEATSATINDNKNFGIPQIIQCASILESSTPLLIADSNTLSQSLLSINLALLPPLQTLINGAQALLSTLTLETGLITVHQSGTFIISSGPYEMNATYRLESFVLPSNARIYYIHIPASPNQLLIENTTVASLVFSNWWPPLIQTTGGISAVDTILDGQRDKIAVAPGPVLFSMREYDLPNSRIILSDLAHNFTTGSVVQIIGDLEFSIGLI